VAGGDFLTIEEMANALGVSLRHARRLADAGMVGKIARGLVDRNSVDRYLQSQRQGRTRAWAEHTAWGAVAILAGRDADWLGATQASRLRSTLRRITDPDDLLTRMRDRAQVRSFEAHRAALPRLGELATTSNLGRLGITDALDDHIDGYLAEGGLDKVVRSLGLRADAGGAVTLRVTGFDFDQVRDLVDTSVVAALDAATSVDPRLRGVGRRTLAELMQGFRDAAPRRATIDDMTSAQQHNRVGLAGPTGRLVTAHRAELRQVLGRHGVTNADIFGSAARGDDHEGSDLDLLVDFPPGTSIIDIIGIKRELEEVLGAPVDLIPRAGLKERVRVAAEKDLVPL
jgi:predicted nucleotidyltransferase